MRIAVVDGQGGGIGRVIVENLRTAMPESTEIIALGTNATATSVMLKAGANEGATGDGAISYCARRADVIMGAASILVADAFLGELGEKSAAAITACEADKILIPLNREKLFFAGVAEKSLPRYIEDAVDMVRKLNGAAAPRA
jgi:hypothetical protein